MITTIKEIHPMFNALVTTYNRYPTETKVKGSTLIDASKSGAVKEYQTVRAVGPNVRGIEVGDVVFIDPKRYAVMKHKEGTLQDGIIKDNPVVGYNFQTVTVNDEELLFLYDSDIKFTAVIEEFDENPAIYIPDNKLIK